MHKPIQLNNFELVFPHKTCFEGFNYQITYGSRIGIIGRKENQLRSFFVLPEWQGKGVGRKLFDAFEKAVRNDGFHKIILESSPLGQPIYEHFGFEKIGSRVKERIGIKYTDAIMGKELN